MSETASLNRKLQSIFSNGRIQVGLEVGSDQGLSPEDYIRIPKSFRKPWAYSELAEPNHRPEASDSVDSLKGKSEWTIIKPGEKLVRIHLGKYYAVNPDGTSAVEMGSFHRDSSSVEEVKQFLSANVGHVRDSELTVEQVQWVHAIRFWSVVAGFVTGSKQREWEVVDTPSDTSNVADELVRIVVGYAESAMTACAARAANWRKSNHATGGDVAAGFTRRWLSKNDKWPTLPDMNARKNAQRLTTTAFYTATHAACVHPILAMMSPTIEEHWALIEPCYGMIMSWDVLESTSIRISPKTQVAGTAIVVDSMVVLKMLVSEGLVPLLETVGKHSALVNAYKTVEEHGIRVASYASWFLNGHPTGISKVPFAQKDSSFSDLVGELAVVGTIFYRGSTISESLALDNAVKQLASEGAKTRWNSLAKARKSASDETVMSVYTRVMGASASSALQMLSSDDPEEVKRGVKDYNNVIANVAASVGIDNPAVVSEDRITTNMSATPAPASDM